MNDPPQQETNRREAHHAGGEKAVLGDVRSHLAWLNKQIEQLRYRIDDHIDHHPDLKRDAELMGSIPGLGKTTVAKVMAYGGDLRRFTNGKALTAFIGISPRVRESGTSVRGRTMICRTGHAALRKALYMPGLVALRHNPAAQVSGQGSPPMDWPPRRSWAPQCAS